MTYPNTPGFQAHSDTSREAAELLKTRDSFQHSILMALNNAGHKGCIAAELADIFEAPRSTINARLRELQINGLVIKTALTRNSPDYNRKQAVYVVPGWFHESMGRGTVKEVGDARPYREALANLIHLSTRQQMLGGVILTVMLSDAEWANLKQLARGD